MPQRDKGDLGMFSVFVLLLLGQSWTTNDDYPEIALRNHWKGAVVTVLAVSPKGSITSCAVSKSSGHKELDDATCTLMMKRLRFDPARDAEGHRIASEKTYTFNWMLPR